MVMCFAPTCKHYSEKHQCNFFVFPKDPATLKKWLKTIRRKDREPSKFSRICSCHFEDASRNIGPTISRYNVDKRFPKTLEVARKRRKENQDVDLQQSSTFNEDPGESEAIVENKEEEDTVYLPQESFLQPGTSGNLEEKSVNSESKTSSAMLEAENYLLTNEIGRLTVEVKQLSVSFSCKHIAGNDQLTRVYTGLPTQDIFTALVSLFSHVDITYYKGWQVARLPKEDQILSTSMKLRLNLLNDDLGC